MSDQDKVEPPSFGNEVKGELKKEAKAWLKWAFVGAAIGATLLGGFGFFVLGFSGLLGGAALGAIIGALGFWLFYLNATTL
jgi:hypothetical protein